MDAHSVRVCIFLAFSIVIILDWQIVQAQKRPIASALYVFGDSTIDTGNNNGLATLAKANFPPYGRDFPTGKPTGRFTDGKSVTDILSGLLGLPDLLPAYLDPDFKGQKLLTGACFGSSGSGYDDVTSQSLNVLTLPEQVENFRRYRSKLKDAVGEDNATKIVSKALFGISMGTNDFIDNYYLNPSTKKKLSVMEYQDRLILSLTIFIKSIIGEGGNAIGVVGLPPFGCLPSQITLHNLTGKTCVAEFNNVARSFNSKLKTLAKRMSLGFPGVLVAYLDIYEKLYDIIKNPHKYGFEETRKGCCGTGLLEAGILCNKASPVCDDPSKYVFWDSVHPTARTYGIIGNDIFQQVLRKMKGRNL